MSNRFFYKCVALILLVFLLSSTVIYAAPSGKELIKESCCETGAKTDELEDLPETDTELQQQQSDEGSSDNTYDDITENVPEGQWLITADTLVWYFGKGLFYSLRDANMALLGFWIIDATAVKDGEIWDIQGGISYEYEEYKIQFGKEPPFPDGISLGDVEQPSEPDYNPDGGSSSNNPDPVPETPDSVPEAPDPVPENPDPVPETPDPVPENPDPVPEAPDPTPENPDPDFDDEISKPVSAPTGQWYQNSKIEKVYYYVFPGNIVFEYDLRSSSVERRISNARWWIDTCVTWYQNPNESSEPNNPSGWRTYHPVDSIYLEDNKYILDYWDMKKYLGQVPPIPSELENLFLDYYEGGAQNQEQSEQEQQDNSDTAHRETSESDAMGDNDNNSGIGESQDKKMEDLSILNKNKEILKDTAKEIGIQFGKEKLEEWAKKELAKYPALDSAVELAKKMIKALEGIFLGIEAGQDLKAIGDGYRQGERNEMIIPATEKWVVKGVEGAATTVPGSDKIPGYGEAVKQISEQSGKDVAHVMKTIQDGGFRSKDTIGDIKNQYPELDVPKS